MGLVRAATRAELAQFQAVAVVTAVLLGGVGPFAAVRTRQVDDDAVALGLGHGPVLSVYAPAGAVVVQERILVTTPAPTVRPPSRIANRNPSSIATAWISSTVIVMLSPGITISTPS